MEISADFSRVYLQIIPVYTQGVVDVRGGCCAG